MSPVPAHIAQDLRTLPDRMRDLPIASNGWIIPWFVARLPSGEPEFRTYDGEKWVRAIRQQLCWVCGERLGRHLTFVIGPMCAINRTASEPPSHLECARWSAKNCPFLSRPHMHRRTADMPEEALPPAGIGLARNPGVTMLWVTYGYHLYGDHEGKQLIRIGDPIEIEYYTEGRRSTRAEVEESVRTGVPELEKLARLERPHLVEEALKEITKRSKEFEKLWPHA